MYFIHLICISSISFFILGLISLDFISYEFDQNQRPSGKVHLIQCFTYAYEMRRAGGGRFCCRHDGGDLCGKMRI